MTISRLYTIPFFLRAKSADVVFVKDVDGSPVVGKTFKVRWNGWKYQTKILAIGTREFCEEEILPSLQIVSSGSFLLQFVRELE
ncbi:hypothetical protein Aduo_004931 [Ancylostoma duodenale]